MGGVSFARLSRLFCGRRLRVHSRLEAHFWKGWVGRKPYEQYHLPCRRE